MPLKLPEDAFPVVTTDAFGNSLFVPLHGTKRRGDQPSDPRRPA